MVGHYAKLKRTYNIKGLTANLSCEAAAQIDGARLVLGCLEPQHDSGGELIVSVTAT